MSAIFKPTIVTGALLSTSLLCTSLLTTSAIADEHQGPRADSHAPIGVMGEHVHSKGEFMLSYRYMGMSMDGNRDDTKDLSLDDVHNQGYRVAPKSMDMDMHMIGGMYAPTNDLTLMLMLNYLDTTMDHSMRMQAMPTNTNMGMANESPIHMHSEFTTQGKGMGDTTIGGLYRLWGDGNRNLLLNLGLSLPTGDIDVKDTTPMSTGNDVQLPYPMQLGSGTYDVLPGLTYTSLGDKHSWGAQGIATLRTGTNDNGYTLGDRIKLNAWYARPFANSFSWSIRTQYENWGNIDGRDENLPEMMVNIVPTADPSRRAGQRMDLALGINWIIPGKLTNRLALEWVEPVYEDLDGPQLSTQHQLVFGYQLSF